jgi:GTP cyclohydrolase II
MNKTVCILDLTPCWNHVGCRDMNANITSEPKLEHLAEAPLPTKYGVFRLVVFRYDDPTAHPELSQEHLAMVMGDVEDGESVQVRVHSECLTSEVLGSLKCDCKAQLEEAQSRISQTGRGVILYLRQEGRGIGLSNKIKAYALQAQGADTIRANELLHLPVDARKYEVAAAMLRHLGIKSVVMMTNNPDKVEALEQLGISVLGRDSVHVGVNQHSQEYLKVKRDRMRHQLPRNLDRLDS